MLKRNNILEIVTPEYITAVVSTDGRIRRKNRNNLGLYIKTQMIMGNLFSLVFPTQSENRFPRNSDY